MATRKPTRKSTTRPNKLSPAVQVAIVTTIGTAVVALITGIFSLAQNSAENSPLAALSPTITLEIPTPPLESPTPDKQRVLFDTYHGSSSILDKLDGIDGANIQGKGFAFEQASQQLTLEYLKQYDVLIISFGYYKDKERYSLVEIEAIREYNKQGGGVLLLGQGWVWTQYNTENSKIEDYPLNLIADGSGIQFSRYYISEIDRVSYKQAPLVFQQQFTNNDKKILGGINLVASIGAPGTLIIDQSINASATALIWGDENTFDSTRTPQPIVMAMTNVEKGRIVAIGTIDFIVPFVDDKYTGTDYPNIYDHMKLLENTLNWLSGNP